MIDSLKKSSRWQILRSELKNKETKFLFRDLAKETIPLDWAKRRKCGFPVPFSKWLREEKYYKMVKYLTERCPWIFESMPLTYQLKYDWLENFEHHNFPFNRWKYIKVDGKRREEMRAKFRPLSFREMQ